MKKDNILKFHELILNQMVYGGKKYELKGSSTREATDELFEFHGKNWLFGTMDKYCKRYINLARERDILKISCYCYILWLKRGFFIKERGLEDVIDTNTKMKEEHFELFKQKISNKLDEWKKNKTWDKFENLSEGSKLSYLSSTLKKFSKGNWTEISEDLIISIYLICHSIWFVNYAFLKAHDEDLGKITDKCLK